GNRRNHVCSSMKSSAAAGRVKRRAPRDRAPTQIPFMIKSTVASLIPRANLRPCRAIAASTVLWLLLPVSLSAQIGQQEYAERRNTLGEMMQGGGVLLVRGASAPERDYMEFHQTPP